VTYIKPTDPQLYGDFGLTVDLSSDGATLAVGAQAQDKNFGAVYVFQFDGTSWAQQQRLVASNAQIGDYFGRSVALSGDGVTLVVGAPTEDSAAVGVGGSQADNSAQDSGAAYVFVRSGTVWSQQAYLKASNTETDDRFGDPVAISSDGNNVVVAATYEDSSATGVDGDQSNNGAMDSGAAYVFHRSGSTWTQAAYVKPSNTDALDAFAWDLELSGDGSLLAIGAYEEDGTGTAYGGNPSANTKVGSGAVYLYRPSGSTWVFDAYLKALNTNADDGFGEHVALPLHDTSIVVGAIKERGGSPGVDGDMTDNSTQSAGAVYIYE
jgi:hypothetical protein